MGGRIERRRVRGGGVLLLLLMMLWRRRRRRWGWAFFCGEGEGWARWRWVGIGGVGLAFEFGGLVGGREALEGRASACMGMPRPSFSVKIGVESTVTASDRLSRSHQSLFNEIIHVIHLFIELHVAETVDEIAIEWKDFLLEGFQMKQLNRHFSLNSLILSGLFATSATYSIHRKVLTNRVRPSKLKAVRSPIEPTFFRRSRWMCHPDSHAASNK